MAYTLVMDFAGQVATYPRRGKLTTQDSLATVTTANYIQQSAIAPTVLYPTDILDVIVSLNPATNVGVYYQMQPTFSNGIITLTQVGTTGTGTANYLAVFTNTTGGLGTANGVAVTHLGNIEAGNSGNAGAFKSYPGAQNSYFQFTAVAQGGAYGSFLRNAAFGQATDITIADPGNSTGYIQTTTQNPDPCANLISFDITVGQAALASGGNVALITSSGSKRYKLRTLQLNSGGTNFSGGGGDRNISITDGTTVYSVIPAATAQALANTAWGATGLPFPAAAAINTSTAAGANLRAIYSGGTTDYTAGSLVLTAVYQRVA